MEDHFPAMNVQTWEGLTNFGRDAWTLHVENLHGPSDSTTLPYLDRATGAPMLPLPAWRIWHYRIFAIPLTRTGQQDPTANWDVIENGYKRTVAGIIDGYEYYKNTHHGQHAFLKLELQEYEYSAFGFEMLDCR
jgi:hypothetical protein